MTLSSKKDVQKRLEQWQHNYSAYIAPEIMVIDNAHMEDEVILVKKPNSIVIL